MLKKYPFIPLLLVISTYNDLAQKEYYELRTYITPL